jgi:hypothetical protein
MWRGRPSREFAQRTMARQPNERALLPAAEPGPSDRFWCSYVYETRGLFFVSDSKVVCMSLT